MQLAQCLGNKLWIVKDKNIIELSANEKKNLLAHELIKNIDYEKLCIIPG